MLLSSYLYVSTLYLTNLILLSLNRALYILNLCLISSFGWKIPLAFIVIDVYITGSSGGGTTPAFPSFRKLLCYIKGIRRFIEIRKGW